MAILPLCCQAIAPQNGVLEGKQNVGGMGTFPQMSELDPFLPLFQSFFIAIVFRGFLILFAFPLTKV